MAAATITKVAIPNSSAGYNLTDSAGFTTLVAGSGNGVKFTYEQQLVVVLKNDSGGAAVFTFKTILAGGYSSYGVTATNPTLTLATGKTYLWRPNTIFRDSSSFVTIECDVAGKALVLDPNG